jgi:hypothetical protein
MTILSREFVVVVVSIGFLALTPRASLAEDKPAPDKPAPPSHLAATRGFMGSNFGIPFSSFEGLELDEDRGPLKLYTKEGDLDMLGPVQVAEVVYYFFNDKFYGVAIHVEDGQDSANLLRILQLAYGYGSQGDPEVPTYYWAGNPVSVRFEINPNNGDGDAFIYDNKVDNDYLEYEKKACEEAAAKL